MEDKLSSELLIYKYNKKYLANLDLSNLDIKNSSADGSQRMLNALEPGTPLPIHRHRKSSETVVCLRGHMREVFYNDCVALNIQLGQWHSVEVSYVKMSRARKCPK